MNSTFAYLVGISEDAYLGSGGKEGYVFDIESKSYRWLNELVKPALLSQSSRKKEILVKQRKTRPEYRIQIWDKSLVSAIKGFKMNPERIERLRPEYQHPWFQGFADAEGSATQNSEHQPQFSIYNTNLYKIKIAGQILSSHNIHFGTYIPPNRNVYQLFITGRDNLKYFLDVFTGVTHPEKYNLLRLFLAE